MNSAYQYGVKLARARWQKEWANLPVEKQEWIQKDVPFQVPEPFEAPFGSDPSSPEVQRLQRLHEARQAPELATRRSLATPGTDLTPEQLERYRELAPRLAREKLLNQKIFGKIPLPRSLASKIYEDVPRRLGKSNPGLRAMTLSNVGAFVSPDVGGNLSESFGVEGPKEKAVGPFQHGIVEHELSEYRGSRSKTQAPIASHISAAPIISEQRAAWRDPEALKALDRLRTTNPDDLRVLQEMKRRGAVGGHTLAPGGRTAYGLEQQIEKGLVTVPQAIQLRRKLGIRAVVPHQYGAGITKLLEPTTSFINDSSPVAAKLFNRLVSWTGNRNAALANTPLKLLPGRALEYLATHGRH